MLRTTHQKRLLGKCALGKVADLLGDSVIILIIRDLLTESKRYCEIERSLEGISSRTLSKKLRYLMKKKIIQKVPDKEQPQALRYSLTTKGAKLQEIITTMEAYGKTYL